MALTDDNCSPRRVQSIENAVQIIEHLEDRDGAGVTDIASTLDLAKGTVHTQLSTLEDNGFVAKHDGEYHVGLRLLELGEHAKNRLDIVDVAGPELDDLAEETDARTQLVVEENGLAVCVYLARGPNAILPPTDVGYREYLHCIASGKALMAHLPDGQVEQLIEKHGLPSRTDETVSDRDELNKELDQIREQGYSFNDQEKLRGLRAVGAPVLGQDGSPIGAISISDTAQNMTDDWFRDQLPQRLKTTANRIEINFSAQHGQ
jgi:DNA-binding IclR family transcriptional regulator